MFVGYSIFAWSLYFIQPKILYKPRRNVNYTPGELGLDYEDVSLTAADGIKIHGWYIPAMNSNFTILFCHGNGGNIMHRLDTINFFNKLGLSCLIFDYRGYGKSQGKPTEEGTYLDAAAAYDWLTKEMWIPAEEIIVFGRSLGGAVASNLATKVHVRGLVVESGFTSYAGIGAKFYPYLPVKWFASFNYNTLDYIKGIHCPLLLIHSKNDEVVPFEFGLELYQASNKPSKFVEIYGSHNDGFLVSNQIYIKAWNDWIGFLKSSEKQAVHQKAL